MAETKEVKVPDIGDFENVDVIEVMVSEGDTVEKESALITLETDKAALDVPSPFAGTIKTLKVSTDDKVSKGDVIATIEASDEAGGDEADGEADEGDGSARADEEAASEPAPEPEEKQAKPAAGEHKDEATAQGNESKETASEGPKSPKGVQSSPDELPAIDEESFSKAHASPSVRKFARELGVDLGRVEGSGRKNRITHDDVRGFVKQVMQGGGAAAGGALPAVPTVDFSRFGEVERKPLGRIQKISGARVHASWVNLPHVTQHDEADVTELESVRKQWKSEAEARGAKLTPLAFLIKASVAALKEFPAFNSSLDPDGETLIYKRYHHIGFAVDTKGGLVVPVIRDADKKSLLDIAAELGDLSDKARGGKLTSDDMQGGCFSISSLGSIGGTAFTPIINAPEVAILGVSRSSVKPVYQDGEFVPRTMLPLSLSYDHRVIDGASAVRFTRFLSETLSSLKMLMY